MSALTRREWLTGAWFNGTRRRRAVTSGEPSGPARIMVFDCIAHQGGQCFTCIERCPVPNAIVSEKGRPRVVPETCTGCGVCRDVCPAPRNAILILPALRRN